jgi:hypothetical protein
LGVRRTVAIALVEFVEKGQGAIQMPDKHHPFSMRLH